MTFSIENIEEKNMLVDYLHKRKEYEKKYIEFCWILSRMLEYYILLNKHNIYTKTEWLLPRYPVTWEPHNPLAVVALFCIVVCVLKWHRIDSFYLFTWSSDRPYSKYHGFSVCYLQYICSIIDSFSHCWARPTVEMTLCLSMRSLW